MDHKQRYLESCQNPSGLNSTILDERLDSEKLDTSDINPQTMEGAIGGQAIPKTSTPAKKVAAETDSQNERRTPERDGGVTESPTIGAVKGPGGAEGGQGDGTVDEGCCGEVASAVGPPALTAHIPKQVPEPIAEISSIHDGDTSAIDLRNPDVRPRSDTNVAGADFFLESVPSEFSSTMSSLLKSAEDLERFKHGYIRQCTRSNLRHSKSVSDIRSLTNSVSSQQEEIKRIDTLIGFILEDMGKSKARLESLEKRNVTVRHYKQQSIQTHVVPYDSLKQQGDSSFVFPTVRDSKMGAELFLYGFGSGRGTHLSLRVTAECGDPNEKGRLPTKCRFETHFDNFNDEEVTRKKSVNSEVTSGSGQHIVDFPKLIEKDVVENEALGYKRTGTVKIVLIVSWDEVITS